MPSARSQIKLLAEAIVQAEMRKEYTNPEFCKVWKGSGVVDEELNQILQEHLLLWDAEDESDTSASSDDEMPPLMHLSGHELPILHSDQMPNYFFDEDLAMQTFRAESDSSRCIYAYVYICIFI